MPEMPPHLITPAELPQWVPGRITCSSAELGWKDVQQRSYLYHGQDVEIPPMDTFMIVHYRQGTTPMDRQYDGRWTRTRCQPSNFSLLSRSAESHWHWTEDVEVSHLYLSNDLLSRVAGDMLDQAVDEVQLHDVLRGTDPLLSHMVDQITREAAHTSVGGALYVEALGVQLAVHLLRDYASCVTRRQNIPGSLSPAQQACLEDYIDAHLQDRITLEAMAGLLNMGVWTFSRQVRKSLGCTAYALVMRRRVERARVLLVHSRMPLKQIAAMCGFSDQAHMTRQFRVQHGTTPSQYRQMA